MMIVKLFISLVLLSVFKPEDSSCTGFLQAAQRTSHIQKVACCRSLNGLSMAGDDDSSEKETEKETEKVKGSEPISLYELQRREAEASKRVQDKLLFPYRFGRAFNAALWTFVLVGFLLNAFGYGYIRGENGMLAIGTLEEQNFQVEVNKGAREANKSAREAMRNQEVVNEE